MGRESVDQGASGEEQCVHPIVLAQSSNAQTCYHCPQRCRLLRKLFGERCKKTSFTPWLLSAALQWKDHSPGLLIRPTPAERFINWIIISITSKHINILMLSSITSCLHF